MANIKLFENDSTTLIGDLKDTIEATVIEERNGQFELTLIYPNGYTFADKLVNGKVVQCNANDELLNQKFRIYNVEKPMDEEIEVQARHISFDLVYDFLESFSTNTPQTCEYCLNEIFRRSNFSRDYQGFSDIVEAQMYKMEIANCLEAIGGKQGSIIDTFGTGAEILRDNKNIHVLNKRGHDNGVHITYAKNMTDINVEEDRSDLITRIYAYAKGKDADNNEIIVTAPNKYVDSPRIDQYEHPFIRSIDFTDKFGQDENPTPQRVQYFAEKYFRDNPVDLPKINYKLGFVPLSKTTEGGPNDNIKLCDIVYVDDMRYNIQTQAKAIKTVFNVLLNRYDSIELGQPKTTLGNLIGEGGQVGPAGPPGPQGPPGADGNIGDFPDSLPNVPQLTLSALGLESIMCDWTFESQVYYKYQLYASKVPNFTPNAFDLIFEGQASSFLFSAKPDETWYFRVRAGNTHNRWTEFSTQRSISTTKIDAGSFIKEATIGNALIGNISADKINAGKVQGQYIEGKNMRVVDGNGKTTFNIDSFGNVSMDVSSLLIASEGVPTFRALDGKANKNNLTSEINVTPGDIKIKASKIDIQGATTIGDGRGNYLKINGYNYEAYTNHIQTMYWGGWQEGGSFLPTMYMGASGFDSTSSGPSGTYFLMKSYSTYHDLAHRSRQNGKFSIMRFHEGGDIVFIPINRVASEGMIQARAGMEILNEYALELKDWNGNVKGRISRGVFELSQIKSIDNTLIQVKDSVRNMTYGNTMGTSDGRWGTIYLSSAPDISSDITLKENVIYLDNKSEVPYLKSNDDVLTYKDMYDYFKNDYVSARYNYKETTDSLYGIIAQDIQKTKVGKNIIKTNDDGKLSYLQETRQTVTEGALKEAIDKIDSLEKRLEEAIGIIDCLKVQISCK